MRRPRIVIPMASAAPPPARGGAEVRLLSGRWAGDYFLGASEGALMRLESSANGSASTAYLPGLAADAASTAAGLSTHRPSSPHASAFVHAAHGGTISPHPRPTNARQCVLLGESWTATRNSKRALIAVSRKQSNRVWPTGSLVPSRAQSARGQQGQDPRPSSA